MMRAWPIALISLALALPCGAQESYREFERGLNLSDAQRAQVDGIKRKYVDEWRALKEESMRKRLELRDLNRPGQREKAERVQRELDQIQTARQRLFRQYSGEVSSVFSDEQRDRFNRFSARENRRPMSTPRYHMHER